MIASTTHKQLARWGRLLSLFLCLGPLLGHGQTLLTSGAVTENLNSLPITAANNSTSNTAFTNGVTIPGWYLGTSPTATTQFRVSDGGSSSAGNHFNFGTAGVAERALGSMAASNTSRFYGWRLKNNTGSVINSITVSYTGEQWRVNNTTPQTLAFGYQTGTGPLTDVTAATFTAVAALNFVSPITSSTASALDGNAAANRQAISATITGLTVADGDEIFIRWAEVRASTTDQGLAVDDVSVSFTTTGGGPVCVAPSGVTVGSVTSTTASVAFTGSATVTGGYTVTATPTTGTAVTATGTASPIALTGLTANTDYSVTVAGDCGSNGTATSTPAVSFTTSIQPIAIAAANTAYTEDFNALVSTGTGTKADLPTGFDFAETGTGADATYTAGTGSANGGDTYSFGASGSTERAFGTLQSGSATPTIGAAYVNNTGVAITSLLISYTGEQWRLGATNRVDRLDFQYSTNATAISSGTFTDFDDLDFVAPVTTGSTGTRDGNLAANQTAVTGTITGLSIAPGATFYIRWNDFNASSSDDGLGVDDLSLTANPVVACNAPTALAASGIAANTATITFTPSASATDYTVTTVPATTPQTVTGSPVSLTGLAAGTAYTVSIVSNCAGGATSGAATVSFTTTATPCNAPTALAATAITNTTATVSFTGSASAVNGYTVTTTPATSLQTLAAGATSVSLTGLLAGTLYTVDIVSNCAGGAVSGAATTSFTTTAVCNAPTALAAGSVTSSTATITFTPSASATDYTVTTSPVTTSQTVTGSPVMLTGLVAGTLYTVSIVSNCAGGATASAATVSFTTAVPAISIAAVNTAYTESFNSSLAATGTANSISTLPLGWTFVETDTNANTLYSAGTGSASGGDTYSFGAAGSTERALGTLASGSLQSTIGAAYTNNTGVAITSLLISYTGEEWRLGTTGNNDQLTFSYSTGGGSFTTATYVPFPALSLLTPSNTGSAGARDGNLAANQTALTATITGLSIAPGATFFLRWVDPDITGSDDGLAVDDFSLTANPAVVACSAPGLPTIASITQTTASVTVAPGANGGTTFTVTATPAGGGAAITATGTSPVSLTGLTPGTSYSVTATSTCNAGFSSPSPASAAATFSTTAALTDLTVSNAQNVQGSYNNVTVTSTGVATLTGILTVNGTLTVAGTLSGNCQSGTSNVKNVDGPGSFVLQAGGRLDICDAAGISSAGATGLIQVTGTRSYSPDATYAYLGGNAQVTGNGLPAQVRSIVVGNANGLTLSQGVSIAQVLTLTTGNLNTGGQGLTLLSSAAGTALVDNNGGVVNGTATVQRYIGSTNAIGYRHYSAPVSNTTVNDLAAPGFAPVFNTSYNSSATPGTVTPFPTVFRYDEGRIASVVSNYGAFDKGWLSPATGDAMLLNRGYTANAPNTALVDFVGTLNTGTQNSGSLTRGTDAAAGWQLLGNPYPAPLDWSTVTAGQRPGVDAAMYVFQSSGQYAGSYRSYANGMGTSPLVVAASGYFVRVSTAGTAGAVNLTNANRVTTFGPQPVFGRGTADTRPQLHLHLSGAAGQDEAFVYFEAGATAGRDAEFDATKLLNPSGLNLASLAGTEALAINGLPVAGAGPVLVPLSVGVPALGSYTIQSTDVANFTGTVTLLDALLNTRTALTTGTAYPFTMAALTAPGRFTLEFSPAGAPLATVAQVLAAQVQLFPNPASASFRVQLPVLTGAAPVQATLLNTLGQVVLSRSLRAPAGQALTADFDVRGLAAGVYTLRLNVAGTSVVRKVVVE